MGRPAVIPPEKKARIVLSILAGEVSIAEAARKEKVSQQSIGRWKAEFVEAGKTALTAGKTGPSTREAQLEAEGYTYTQGGGVATFGVTGAPDAANCFFTYTQPNQANVAATISGLTIGGC